MLAVDAPQQGWRSPAYFQQFEEMNFICNAIAPWYYLGQHIKKVSVLASAVGRIVIKILAVDDHAIVRKGLKQILADNREMQVAGEASSAAELFEKLQSKTWDVLMLDLSLPDQSGLEVLGRVRELYPAMPVLILSVHDDVQYAMRMLAEGAAGYLTKESAPQELRLALEKVIHGSKYVSHALAEKLVLDFSSKQEKPHHENLSKRELQVLALIASGKSVKEVGDELNLSVKTVSTHRVRILKKMGMKHNAELIRYALDHGLAS